MAKVYLDPQETERIRKEQEKLRRQMKDMDTIVCTCAYCRHRATIIHMRRPARPTGLLYTEQKCKKCGREFIVVISCRQKAS